MDAEPQVQLRLLDLQALESGIDRLAAARRTLPEIAELEGLSARLRELGAELDTAQAASNDTSRAQARLENDVEAVRTRAARDQQRLDSGAVSAPRELENLQSEIASLMRRRDVLEDELLEVMEAAEQASGRVADLTKERDAALAERAAAVTNRDASWAKIDEQTAQHQASRAALASELPADLITLYEKLRASSGGVGAARLYRRRCEGCHLELSGRDLDDVAQAPPSQVLRCEECRRILVRTEESGL